MSEWRAGYEGADVVAYQADLVALGYDLPKSTNRRTGRLDGIVGPEVLAVTEEFVRANFCPRRAAADVYDVDTVPEWVRLVVDEAAQAQQIPTQPERNTGIVSLGAWAGSSALRPSGWQTYLRTAKEVGLHEVSFMLNDNTRRTDWHTFVSHDRIIEVVRAYRDAGIRVCLTSWIRPDLAFIDRMFDELFELAAKSGAERVENDAEEPWTTRRYERHDVCVARVAERLRDKPVPYGVTAILYHSAKSVGPLMKLADFDRLQAYATKRQTAKSLHPGTIIATAHKLHLARYGEDRAHKLEPAVALYHRAGAGGMGARAALRADYSAIERNPLLNASCGWSLGWLRRSAALQAEVRAWRDRIDGLQEAA